MSVNLMKGYDMGLNYIIQGQQDDLRAVFKGQPYKWHKSFTEHHGLRFCDIHSLRHFNATVLIQAGVDAATVSSALGHSSISTTTSIYYHAFQEAQARTGPVIASVMNFTDNLLE